MRGLSHPGRLSPRMAGAGIVLFVLAACGGGGGGGGGGDSPVTPSLAVGGATVTEAPSGVQLVFPVTLSAASASAVSARYSAVGQSAAAGEDFEAVSGTVTLSPGRVAAEIRVPVFDDADSEPEETVELRLSDPVNALLANTSAIGRIRDNDAPAPVAGLDERPANPTCVAPARPVPAARVRLERTFAGLPAFDQPTKLLREPGSDGRWFVLEKGGRVRVFANDDSAAEAPVWLDLSTRVNTSSEGGLLGLAFDPDWPDTPAVYVSYTGHPGGPMRSLLSRFTPNETARPTDWREEILLTVNQDFDNHNGGDIAFGSDGFLYLGLGDGGSGGDPFGRAQDTTRLLGSLLRIAVRGVAWPSPAYTIPGDNPNADNARCGPAGNPAPCPEVYAWGFRNPWRWSFDRATGALWLGDVGQNSREEINRVERGGNYGWDCREGTQAFEPDNCSAGALTDPIAEYDHSLGRSITGGFVYRGGMIPGLAGRYVFGDFGSGRIWALEPEGSRLAPGLLLDTSLNIVAFAENADGELLVVDFGGQLYRLLPAGDPAADTIAERLSETGCTLAGDATQPAEGLVPYALNAAFWSDGAAKSRWMAIPDGTTVEIDDSGDWAFPAGSVLAKEFRVDDRRIETRLLMRHPDGVWAGYTYAWNEAGTEAFRVRGGLTRDLGSQLWIYPGESECMACHTRAAGFSLGAETAQLNRAITYPRTGRTANQLFTLDHIGYLTSGFEEAPDELPALTDPSDRSAEPEARARAYLHTNCSQCHRPSGPTPSDMDLRWTTPLAQTRSCDTPPTGGDLGVGDARLIAPGAADRSLVPLRMARRDIAGMPPLASARMDEDGIALVAGWVDSLGGCD